MEQLNKNSQQRVVTLYRKLNGVPQLKNADLPANLLDWVLENVEEIAAFIDAEYSNKNTKKSFYSCLGLVMKALGEQELYKRFSKVSTDLNKEVVIEEKKNELSGEEIEHYRTWPEIINLVEEIEEAYENIGTPTLQQHMVYLVCQLYTRAPPMRRQPLMDAVFVESVGDAREYHGNSVFPFKLSPTGEVERYAVYIKQDKVVRSHGHEYIDFPEDLSQIIDDSLALFPRVHLLTLTDPDKSETAISPSALDKLLRSTMQVGIDNLRSAYISHHFTNDLNMLQKEEIARRMRTSFMVAATSYMKLQRNVALRNELPDTNRVDVFNAERGQYALNRVTQSKKDQKYYQRNKRKILGTRYLKKIRGGQKVAQQKLEEYGINQTVDGGWALEL